MLLSLLLLLQSDSRHRRHRQRDTSTHSAAATTASTTSATATTADTSTESIPWPADEAADSADTSHRWRIGHSSARARWLFLRFAGKCIYFLQS